MAAFCHPTGNPVPVTPQERAISTLDRTGPRAALPGGGLPARRAGGRLVRRPRVCDALDALGDVRLAVLSAPPGFGKSTALIDWLDRSAVDSVWVHLEPGHDDPAHFARAVLAAVAGEAESRSAVSLTSAPALPDDVARLIVEAIADLRASTVRPLVVVLDDFHVLRSVPVHQVTQALVEHLPSWLRLAIATREDPPLRLARLRVAGDVVELRADTLRFTQDEAATFFADRMGLELTDEDIGVLVAKTEGWPALLQLAGLSLVGRSDPAAHVRSFAAQHRLVLDYLTEEVLATVDPETADFLLRTSRLGRLTGDLCDAVTGRTDGAATLERLERANLLLVPLDEDRTWYRYHQLFADVLHARARAAGLDTRDLDRHAVRWFLDHGYARDALALAVDAGVRDEHREILFSAASQLIHTGDLACVRNLLDRVAVTEARASLPVATLQAWALALADEPAQVEQWLADAQVAADRAAPGTEPLAPPLPGYAAMIRSVVARHEGRLADAVALAELGLSLEPAGMPHRRVDLFRGDGLSILGHALLDAGETTRAIDTYRAAIPMVRRAGNRLAVAEMTRNLARLEARRGRPEAGLEVCRSAMAQSDDEAPSDALVLLAQAELLDALRSPDAPAVAQRALDLARRGGDLETARAAQALLASNPRDAAPPGGKGLLTGRELEVLRLLAVGRSNRQIATELYVTVGTAKTHVHAIAVKLDATNRVEAISRARQLGLLG